MSAPEAAGAGLATVTALYPDRSDADTAAPVRPPRPGGPGGGAPVLAGFLAVLILAGGSGWIAGTYGFGVLLDLALAVVAACLLIAIVGLPYAHARGWLR